MQNILECFKPCKTMSVSVTGLECSLKCAHCGGHYLKSMVGIHEAWEQGKKRDVTSCLISGGCDKSGKVPFDTCADEIKQLKSLYKINIHAGMVQEPELEKICELADIVSFDIPASDKIIRNVYGLGYNKSDYINVFRRIKEKTRIIPHICIGLGDPKDYEKELLVLDDLAKANPEKLCFIIFTPVQNTRFEHKKSPKISLVQEFILQAQKKLCGTRLYLGCMRPGGSYRDEVDTMAVESGIDGIVMPSRKAVARADDLGIELVWKEECCAF